MPSDAIQHIFQVGDVVNVPCTVTAISGTSEPALTLTTIYLGWNGSADTISVDSKQVIQKQ